jgi:predicted CDP-diglyceride synthetase/phosphatidate cytidylyltransferase
MVFVVISSFAFLILLIWVFSFLILVGLPGVYQSISLDIIQNFFSKNGKCDYVFILNLFCLENATDSCIFDTQIHPKSAIIIFFLRGKTDGIVTRICY